MVLDFENYILIIWYDQSNVHIKYNAVKRIEITKKIQNIQTLEIFKPNKGKQWNLLNTGIGCSKNYKNNTFPFMGHKFHCATILGSFMWTH